MIYKSLFVVGKTSLCLWEGSNPQTVFYNDVRALSLPSFTSFLKDIYDNNTVELDNNVFKNEIYKFGSTELFDLFNKFVIDKKLKDSMNIKVL